MSPLRRVVLAVLLVLLAIAGAGIIGAHDAADSPDELFAKAQAQLRDGQPQAAAATARRLLEREPGYGRAFGLLARALADEGSEAEVLARYLTAAHRAPRDVHVRSWLAVHYLQAADFPRAIAQFDALLTVSPGNRATLLPMLAKLAQAPEFADALATYLADKPRWRTAVLRATTKVADDAPDAADNLYGALRRKGGLTAEEASRWIDGMLADGRWGAAYAHWFSGLDEQPDTLSMPYNGDFGQVPTSSGFDWHIRRTKGVVFDRVALAGGRHAARLSFLGRPVDRVGLEVPLLLAPGHHRLTLRLRTEGFQSDQGLAWTLTCSDGRTRIGDALRLPREARTWTSLEFGFDVPADGCEGQWLRLVNPAPRGVAQALRGQMQVTDVGISP